MSDSRQTEAAPQTSSAEGPTQIVPEPPSSNRKLFFTVFPSIVLPMFLGVVDQTIVATSLPAISSALGDVERISWIVISYLIANTIAAPVYGQLGDALGRRRMMFIALAIMISASILCALSTNLLMLIFARVLQGFGGGGLMTLSQALVGEVVPPRERARYQGYLSAVVVSSNAFGPIVGGYLTQVFGWRSIFLINIPLGLAAILLTRRLPRPLSRQEDQAGGEIGAQSWHFDFPGLLYFVSFIVPALLALEQLKRVNLATIPYFIGLFAVSILALLLLLRRENRVTYPLIPLALLRRTAIWRSDALAACHGAALVSLITFIPVYLRVARGASASETGLLLLPIAIGIGLGSLITGRLVSQTGRTMIFPSLALIPVIALMLLLALRHEQLALAQIALILGLQAFCMGSVMSVVNITVQTEAGLANLGAAAGSVQFSRTVGATFGTALVSTLLFFLLTARDPAAAGAFGSLMAEGPVALERLAPATRAAIQEAMGETFRDVFFLIAFYGLLAMGCAWSNPARRFK